MMKGIFYPEYSPQISRNDGWINMREALPPMGNLVEYAICNERDLLVSGTGKYLLKEPKISNDMYNYFSDYKRHWVIATSEFDPGFDGFKTTGTYSITHWRYITPPKINLNLTI
jgi:hypothetical protein